MKNQIKKVLSIVLVAAMCLSSFALCVFAEECVHVWTELGRNDATCTEDGTVASKCDLCGETKLEAIPASHTVESWINVPATCTDAEYYKGECVVEGCGEEVISLVHPVDKSELDGPIGTNGEHDTYEETVYAVHGENGVTYKVMIKCHNCTYAVEKEGTEIEGSDEHTLKWVITTEPDCTNTGVAKLVCTGEHTDPSNPCTYVEKDNVTIAALGHDIEDLGAKTPACGADGYQAHKNCKRCGADFKPELVNGELVPFEGSVEVAFNPETYAHHVSANLVSVKEASAPHCTFVDDIASGEDGYFAHVKCEECDELFKYNGNEWVHVNAVEEDEYDSTNAAHHTLTPVEAKAPKCGEAGYEAHQKCTVCGALFTTEGDDTTKDALKVEYVENNFEHHNATFKPEALPQCQPNAAGKVGTKAHYACECGALFTSTTTGEGEEAVTTYTKVDAAALEIAYDDANKDHHHYVFNEANSTTVTCTANGISKYRCDRCYDEYEITVTAQGHDYEGAVVDRTHDATCTAAGYILTPCNNCDYVLLTNVDAKDEYHTNTTLVEIEAQEDATCTEAGKTAVMGCPNCDYTEGGTEIPKLQHSFEIDAEDYVKVIVDASTCTTPETYKKQCTDCTTVEKDGENDKVYTGTTHPHTMAQVITAETTDCMTAGQIAEYCTECGGERRDGYYLLTSKQTEDRSKYVFYADEVAAEAAMDADHAWENIEEVEASCTVKAYVMKVCTTCGKIAEENGDFDKSVASHKATMQAAGKTPTVVEVLIPATCETTGTTKYQCTACNDYYNEDVNHAHRTVEEIPANCLTETNGRAAGVYCDTLNVWVSGGTTIPFAHNMTTVPAQGATCTQYGWNDYEFCTACEAAETKGVKSKDACLNAEGIKINAKGHEFAKDEDGEYIWVIVTSATCKDKGSKSRTCTVCADEEGRVVTEEIAKTACEESDLITLSQAPVCTVVGTTITSAKGFAEFTYCQKCFANDKNITAASQAELVAALKVAYELPAHTVTTTNFGDETDCTVDSFTEHKCATCGIYVITNFVEGADDHDWADPVAADCTNDGYTQCKNCDVKKDIIPAENHINANGDVLENKCTNAHITDRVCVGCQTLIEANHSEGYLNPTVTEPTCTSVGFTTKKCEYCGESEVYDYTDALEHEGDEFAEVVTMPTINTKGEYSYYCTHLVDGVQHTYTKEVDELAEIGVSINAVTGTSVNADQVNPEDVAFVNGGLVTFMIDLTMPTTAIDSILATFTYDPAEMTFVSATVNNSFGVEGYTLSTDYNAVMIGGVEVGRVNVAVNSIVNNARQDMVFEEGTVVENFVTLTFRLAPSASGATLTALAIETTSTTSDKNDIASSAIEGKTIESVTLADLNGDFGLDMHDVNAIQDLITAEEYNAAADLNMDGAVDILDWGLMRQIILEKIAYEDLFANA